MKFELTQLTANTTSYRASWSTLDLNESLSSLYSRYRAEAESAESGQDASGDAVRPAGQPGHLVSNERKPAAK